MNTSARSGHNELLVATGAALVTAFRWLVRWPTPAWVASVGLAGAVVEEYFRRQAYADFFDIPSGLVTFEPQLAVWPLLAFAYTAGGLLIGVLLLIKLAPLTHFLATRVFLTAMLLLLWWSVLQAALEGWLLLLPFAAGVAIVFVGPAALRRGRLLIGGIGAWWRPRSQALNSRASVREFNVNVDEILKSPSWVNQVFWRTWIILGVMSLIASAGFYGGILGRQLAATQQEFPVVQGSARGYEVTVVIQIRDGLAVERRVERLPGRGRWRLKPGTIIQPVDSAITATHRRLGPLEPD
jgi:hypothetical protein